jgi:VWFA-related protein
VRKRTEVFLLLLVLIPCSSIAFDDKKSGKDSKGQLTFRLPVNVIMVNVTVTDKKGNPVTDLTQSDFKIYEDGKPQSINTFAQESYFPDQESAAAPKSADAHDTASPPLPRPVQALRPRMISIFIDDLTMNSLDYYPRLIKALKNYVSNDLGPQDHVGILSGSGRVQFPYSDDKQMLEDTIAGLSGKLNYSMVTRSQCPEITDLQAYKIAINQDAMELAKATNKTQQCFLNLSSTQGTLSASGAQVSPSTNSTLQAQAEAMREATMQDQESWYRTIRVLDVLRGNIRSMKHFDAEKSIVIFSDGFLSYIGCPSCQVAYQLQEVVDLALSSGVVLNAVNLRGLESGIDVSRHADPNGLSMSDALDDILAQEDPLTQLSYDTGGTFFHNDNDLYKGLNQIVRRQRCYYILTYASPIQKANGSFHRIKLETTRPGVEISYRKGYYSPMEQMTFERRKREDIIDALQAPGNLNEIPVTLSYNCYRNDSSTYGVSFLTNVDIRKVHFLDEDARRKNLISLVLAAYDDHGKFIDGLEKTIDLKLLESSYAGVLKQGLSSRVELKLPFGHYKIKTVVRESVQGKIGSLTKAIEVP